MPKIPKTPNTVGNIGAPKPPKEQKRKLETDANKSISGSEHLRKKTNGAPAKSPKTKPKTPQAKDPALESGVPIEETPMETDQDNGRTNNNQDEIDLPPVDEFDTDEMIESTQMDIDLKSLVLADKSLEEIPEDDDLEEEEPVIPEPQPPTPTLILKERTVYDPMERLNNMDDRQLRDHVGQLRIGTRNSAAIHYSFIRFVPQIMCPACNCKGKFKVHEREHDVIFRCKSKWKETTTSQMQKCTKSVDASDMWISIMKFDTFDHNSTEANFLRKGLWKVRKPTQQNKSQQPKEMEVIVNARKALKSCPEPLKKVVTALVKALEAATSAEGKKVQKPSYASVTKSTPQPIKTPTKPKNPKSVNPRVANMHDGLRFMEQRDTIEEKRKAAGDILSGINPVTGKPAGIRKAVHERMVHNTDEIKKDDFKQAIRNHSILHIKGIKKAPLKVTRNILAGAGLEMGKLTHSGFYDLNTLQIITETRWKEEIVDYFNNLNTTTTIEIEEPVFPTNVENPQDPGTIESQELYIKNMAYCCLANRTLLGATVLQATIPVKYQKNLLNRIDDLAAGRRNAGRTNGW